MVPKLFYMVAQFQGCKNFVAPLLQSHRNWGALVGLAPPKQSAKPPQIEIWNTINHWSLCQTFNKVREIVAHELYCCLLPQCEALRRCRLGFAIATVELRWLPSTSILLCDSVLGHCSACSFESASWHNAFVFCLALTTLGISVLLWSSVVPSVTG